MTFALVAVALTATDPAADAATARQEKYRTVDVTIRVKQVVEVNGVSAMKTLRTGKGTPEEETTVESTGRVALDGDKVRVENNHPTWEIGAGPGRVKPFAMVEVADATNRSRRFHLQPDALPIGAIDRPGRPVSAELYFAPLLAYYRGPAWLGKLVPTGRRQTVAGRECVEYVSATGPAYWLDPAAECRLVREDDDRPGRESRRFDIEYGPDGPVRWVKTATARDGRLRWTVTADVVRASVNEPLPTGTFDIAFPPGTQVADQRLPGDQWNEFVVAADGSLVLVPPPAPESVWDRPFVRRLAVAGGIAAVMLLVLLVWLRRSVRE